MTILPWQQEEWQRIEAQMAGDSLPHGMLIVGPADSGKSIFTDALGKKLLCKGEQPPCGVCSQCHLLAAGSHPDLLLVAPEDSAQIKIDQIRGLTDWANQTAQQGGRKVCIINPADSLNIQASNALLKSLEEPPPGTYILLVTSQPMQLLPTLRSRCQRLECRLPGKDESLQWLRDHPDVEGDPELLLEIASGIPLRVVNAIDKEFLALRQALAAELLPLSAGDRSPLRAASELSRSDPEDVLNILYQLIADSIGYSMSGEQMNRNSDLKEQIRQFASRVPVLGRYELLDRVTGAKAILNGTSNANKQMLLEWVFLKVAQPARGLE